MLVPLRTFVLLLALVPAPLSQALDATTAATRPVAALDAELLEEMTNGRLERFPLLAAALIASGIVEPSVVQSYMDRFADLNRRLPPRSLADTSLSGRAEILLAHLHQHVLTGSYEPSCTEVDRSLDTGDFNCVTATILYRCLAADHDLPVETLVVPGHVYCQLSGSEPIEIQTTSPHGLVAPEQRVGVPGQRSGSASATARQLSEVQLVAKIYYNRGITLLEREAFSAALPLLRLAGKLDPADPLAHRNVLACLNNWALAECQAGRFERALELLEQGYRLDPAYAAFADNELYIYEAWARSRRQSPQDVAGASPAAAAASRSPAAAASCRKAGLGEARAREARSSADMDSVQ